VPRTAVVALGGNAITRQGQAGTAAEQEENADRLAAGVADLRAAGWRVVVVHGNGPQVGNLAIQQQEAAERVPALPLATLVAMTQGQLGSLLELALIRADAAGSGVVSVLTHVVVDGEDPAFGNPTKPVGPFMTEDEATHVADELGWTVGEDAGRGYRRLVPSPVPTQIVELEAITALVEQGVTVVAAGGGGVPVLADGASFRPIDARVQLDFGKETAREIAEMTVEEARGHQADGQFPEGSMGPKMRAAMGFVEEGGGVAVITDASRVRASLELGPSNGSGTRIVPASRIGAVS
jgi:carbamate kinase